MGERNLPKRSRTRTVAGCILFKIRTYVRILQATYNKIRAYARILILKPCIFADFETAQRLLQ